LALSPNLRGSLLMMLAMSAFALNDASTKFLSAQMSFAQVMLLRGVVACLLIGALAYHQGALRPLRVVLAWPVVLRVCGEMGATVLFLAAITKLPLANASAIIQSLPLAITVGAALLFREPVGWRRWSAIVAGFVGVLVIVRPGAESFNGFSLLALGSVAFCVLRDLATKRIPAEVPTLFVTLLTTIAVTAIGGGLMMPLGGWRPPSSNAVMLLGVSAVLVLIGYQCVILALRIGDLSAVAPFRYTQLLWSLLLGYLVFGDVPDAAMLFGASLIVLSGLYTIYRETQRNRSVASDTGMPPDGL
jgi:drug/metabolite transporter (DMT)-like permease